METEKINNRYDGYVNNLQSCNFIDSSILQAQKGKGKRKRN